MIYIKTLPKVYVNPLKKKFNNEQEIYKSTEKLITKQQDNIAKKVSEIFNQKNHVYKSKVKIVVNSEEKVETIIGLANDKLITIEGKLINIKDISQIESI